eukprot:scaffold20831_cov79-Skeletonema_dohrnii-CCMP3373.AAC.1
MTRLAKYITVEHNKMGGMSSEGTSIAALIRDEIQNEFVEEDVEQLRRVFPGCAELLGTRRHSLCCPSSEANATVPLRRASGTKLGSWSDIATLDLLKSIVLDGEIRSLLIVGAYRED